MDTKPKFIQKIKKGQQMAHDRGKFLEFVKKASVLFLKHTASGAYPLKNQYEERGKGTHTQSTYTHN